MKLESLKYRRRTILAVTAIVISIGFLSIRFAQGAPTPTPSPTSPPPTATPLSQPTPPGTFVSLSKFFQSKDWKDFWAEVGPPATTIIVLILGILVTKLRNVTVVAQKSQVDAGRVKDQIDDLKKRWNGPFLKEIPPPERLVINRVMLLGDGGTGKTSLI